MKGIRTRSSKLLKFFINCNNQDHDQNHPIRKPDGRISTRELEPSLLNEIDK